MKKTVKMIALIVNGKFDESLLFQKADVSAQAADTLTAAGDRVVALPGTFTYDDPCTDKGSRNKREKRKAMK